MLVLAPAVVPRTSSRMEIASDSAPVVSKAGRRLESAADSRKESADAAPAVVVPRTTSRMEMASDSRREPSAGRVLSPFRVQSRYTELQNQISALGMHGRGRDAIAVFNELCNNGFDPDDICFVSVLDACSHTSLLDEGRRYFQMMKDEYHIIRTVEHYSCMVNLLGRAGCIDEAYQMITHEMPMDIQPHAGIWGVLLSACRTYSNVEIGEVAASHLFKLEPNNMGNYVLLSNIYAKAQRWDGVQKIVHQMWERNDIRGVIAAMEKMFDHPVSTLLLFPSACHDRYI